MVMTMAYAIVAWADFWRSLGYKDRIEELTPSFHASAMENANAPVSNTLKSIYGMTSLAERTRCSILTPKKRRHIGKSIHQADA